MDFRQRNGSPATYFMFVICNTYASRRSQLAPIISHQIKSVVRVFVSISIFGDFSRKENTYGKRSWNTRDNKGIDLPLIIGGTVLFPMDPYQKVNSLNAVSSFRTMVSSVFSGCSIFSITNREVSL